MVRATSALLVLYLTAQIRGAAARASGSSDTGSSTPNPAIDCELPENAAAEACLPRKPPEIVPYLLLLPTIGLIVNVAYAARTGQVLADNGWRYIEKRKEPSSYSRQLAYRFGIALLAVAANVFVFSTWS
jgi:hypothetical protein